MKIVIFGLAITSSWGNGHATTYRALVRALNKRGHRVDFFERDLAWYRKNRDLPAPEFCRVHLYDDWRQVLPEARRELRDADLAIVGSYAPDALDATRELFDSPGPVKAFYDIDTPITVAALREQVATEYLKRESIPDFDLYLSFTGGPMLRELETVYGARLAAPLYCSFDPDQYHPRTPGQRYRSDMSYMGTYAPDRQPKIAELFCAPARQLPNVSFLLAGPQYPASLQWPENVRRITHLNPRWHPAFYSSSRLTLNVTRRDMVQAGYSPSVRLFEAAACGAAIASDNWPGLDTFLEPGREVLLPGSGDDVVRYLRDFNDSELRRIGMAAHERMMAAHTSDHRAQQLESLAQTVAARPQESSSVAV